MQYRCVQYRVILHAPILHARGIFSASHIILCDKSTWYVKKQTFLDISGGLSQTETFTWRNFMKYVIIPPEMSRNKSWHFRWILWLSQYLTYYEEYQEIFCDITTWNVEKLTNLDISGGCYHNIWHTLRNNRTYFVI